MSAMNNSHVEEEVGKLKEEIQRLGQQQPDGSYKVRPFPAEKQTQIWHPRRVQHIFRPVGYHLSWDGRGSISFSVSPHADSRFGVCYRSSDVDSPDIAHFSGFCAGRCGFVDVPIIHQCCS
jgi:hypothetical protein